MPPFNPNRWLAQLKTIILRWLKLGIILATLFSLTGYLGRFNLYLELTSHFKLQYFGFAICGLILFLIFRTQKLWVALCAFCIVINLAEIIPWYLPLSTVPPATSGVPLRVLLANVLTSNQSSSEVISLVKEEQPDIVVLLEIDSAWSTALKPLQDVLPNALIHPRDDNFGLAIYSKIPLEKASVKYFVEDWEVPSLLAEVMVNEQRVSILATHPLPPINPVYFEVRNRQLAAMSEFLQNLTSFRVAIGDLNTSLWSPFYQQFIQNSGLYNTRSGFGIQPTWPTVSPLLYIPLDHILVSSDIAVVESRTGRNIGSDHLPVIADLIIPYARNRSSVN